MRKLLALLIVVLLTLSVAAQVKVGGTGKVGGTTKVAAVSSGGGGGFPTTSVLDNFNRADEGPPPSSNWTSGVLSADVGLVVIGNQAKGQVGDSGARWNATFGPDVEMFWTPTGAFVGQRGYFCLNNAGTSTVTGYAVITDTSSVYLFRVDNGSFNQMGAAITQTVTGGDSVGASKVGSTLTAYYKASGGSWTALDTRTDSTYSCSGTQIGLYLNSTNGGADDFGGGTR